MSARYEFIDAEKATRNPDGSRRYAVRQMCTWLRVSTSGFYAWAARPASPTARRRADLAVLVQRAFTDSGDRYGYRRVHAQLARWGRPCTPELVRALMRQLGLTARRWTRRRSCTRQDGRCAPIPDLVGRNFTTPAPGARLVEDVTYIPTDQGWLYLAMVIDCSSRAIAGWAMGEHNDTALVTAAIRMAARRLPLPVGAVFHSDRGSNYTSADHARVLARLGIRQSVGATGICWDNSLAESVNAAVKVELVHHRRYTTRSEARADIARYIELFYNTRRLHSTLGYRTPSEALHEHQYHQQAA